MNRVMDILRKLERFVPTGKTGVYIKGLIFINLAFFCGMWLGLNLFFPDEFVLSKINNALFIKDMGLTADDVSVSPFLNITLSDGMLTKKGEEVITFGELEFSPSLTGLMSGEISGDLYIDEVNGQGGAMELSFDSSDTPCYSFDLDDLPVAMFNAMMTDLAFTGTVSGEGGVCLSENQKYSGEIELSGDEIVMRGKIPTPMGDFDIGSIILGKLDLLVKIDDNKADIEKFLMSGLMDFDIIGKLVLNSRAMLSSRLDLDVRAKVPDPKKLAENAALNLLINQMSQYKTDKENDFAFMLRGFLSKPQLSKAPKERNSAKSKIDADESKEKASGKAKPRNIRKRPVTNSTIGGRPESADQGSQGIQGNLPFSKKDEVRSSSEKHDEKADFQEKIEPSADREDRQNRPERQTKTEHIEMEPLNTGLPAEDQHMEEDISVRTKKRHQVETEAESETETGTEKASGSEESDNAPEADDSEEQ